MQPRSTILQIALFGFLLSVSQVTRVNAQEPNFDGKTVRIVVGFSAGGGFDAYARAIARHLGKHIPGKPTIIVENMPGAGSLIAANFTYNQAKPDGLTIGHFIGGVVVGQVLGNPGAQFDSQRFEWIGAPSRLEAVCALTKTTGVIDIKSWMAVKTPVKLGATGPGSETYDVPTSLAGRVRPADADCIWLQRHCRHSPGRGKRRSRRHLLGLGGYESAMGESVGCRRGACGDPGCPQGSARSCQSGCGHGVGEK